MRRAEGSLGPNALGRPVKSHGSDSRLGVSGRRYNLRGLIIIVVMVAVAISGIAAGYGIGSTISSTAKAVSTTTTSAAQTPYVITLVITTGNEFNSSIGDQPAYYVVGPNGLQSSAQINLPAQRLIELVIINYDNGNATLTNSKYANVSGVVGNQILLVNNTLINSTMGTSGIQIRGGENVTSLSASVIAHTFTIPSLGINIPVGTLSTEVAYFKVDNAGTYTWFCMTECGSGAEGLGGAMATPGWMTGSVVVQ